MDSSGSDADDLLSMLDRSADADVAGSWEMLSERYRLDGRTPVDSALTTQHVQGYAVARAPATFAATRAVMREIARRRPTWAPLSLLDIGAGLGTSAWAGVETFSSIRSVTLVERSAKMASFGAALLSESSLQPLREAQWKEADAFSQTLPSADLVCASYILGELDEDRVQDVVSRWWASCSGELVLLNPGTPRGFANIVIARTALLGLGARLTAPCPSEGACPMEDADWCHFAVRLQRTPNHRRMKDGSLGFEDEKFSYVVASRSEPQHPAGRLVRHPQVRSGHIRLSVCVDDSIREVVVGKARKAAFRWARNASWGDEVPAEVVAPGSLQDS